MQGPKPELGVPWYGTRYGHNLAEQVNQQMLYCTVLYYTVLYCTVLYPGVLPVLHFKKYTS